MDEKTMEVLKQRRDAREEERKKRADESMLRKDRWVLQFEKEKASRREAYVLETQAAYKAVEAAGANVPNV